MADIIQHHAADSSDGLSYAQMGRFSVESGDAAGTNNADEALKDPNGKPVANQARNTQLTAAGLVNEPAVLYRPARAKRNLVLRIVGRRADGYHLLETLFHAIDLHSVVAIVGADLDNLLADCALGAGDSNLHGGYEAVRLIWSGSV